MLEIAKEGGNNNALLDWYISAVKGKQTNMNPVSNPNELTKNFPQIIKELNDFS